MQMNGIHVTPVIKGSCLFAKHWNAIWQFCWRQQAQKNNPHLPPKKQKPWAGGGGRQSFVVCAGVTENLLAACSAQSLESCTSSAGKFILLPLFYTVLYPGTPGSETAAKHQTVSTTSSSPTSLTTTTSSSPTSLTPPHPPLLFCPVTCWKFVGEEQISQSRPEGKTQNFQHCFARCGRSTTCSAVLTTLLVTLIWHTVKEILC